VEDKQVFAEDAHLLEGLVKGEGLDTGSERSDPVDSLLLADSPDVPHSLEVEEAAADADEGESSVVAVSVAGSEAGSGGGVMRSGMGSESVEEEGVVDPDVGDMAIERLERDHRGRSGKESQVDTAGVHLVLVTIEEDIQLAAREADSWEFEQVAGRTDSSVDEEQENRKDDLRSWASVRNGRGDWGVDEGLVFEADYRERLVGIDTRDDRGGQLGKAGWTQDDRSRQVVALLNPADARQAQSHSRLAETHAMAVGWAVR